MEESYTGFRLSTDKTGKDRAKAAYANAYTGFGVMHRSSFTGMFLEPEKDEETSFKTPGTYMDSGRIVIDRNGSAHYARYAKYTGDEFFTDSFLLPDILALFAGEPSTPLLLP